MPEIPVADGAPAARGALIPPERTGYLGEIAQQGREIGERIERSAATADTARHCYEALKAVGDPLLPEPFEPYPADGARGRRARAVPGRLQRGARRARQRGRRGAPGAPGADRGDHLGDVLLRRARPGGHRRQLPRHAERAARPQDRGAALLAAGATSSASSESENLPGSYPYTAGVYPYRRAGEDPIRMFAGEGTPEQTNRRFHYLSAGPAGRAPLDRVRLGHALRRGSPSAARHLRQGRQLGRLDRHRRRREAPLLRASTSARRRPRSR